MIITRKERIKIEAIFYLKNALYLCVNVFITGVLIEDTIFMSPTGDGTAILCDHPSHVKI